MLARMGLLPSPGLVFARECLPRSRSELPSGTHVRSAARTDAAKRAKEILQLTETIHLREIQWLGTTFGQLAPSLQ